MASSDLFAPHGRNRLLAALPASELDRIMPKTEVVRTAFKEVLYEANEPVSHVWFPIDGVISLLTVMEDGATIEVASVGNEGFIGLPVFLGASSTPGRALAQIPGHALRMSAEDFRDEVRGDGPLIDVLRRYTQGLVNQIAQTAACNRLHTIEERSARWILMTHDRVGEDAFPLTHHFLSQMLGVRRATVTVALGMLEKAGVIDSTRGRVTVLDREGLENASCECYRIVRDEYARLLDSSPVVAAD